MPEMRVVFKIRLIIIGYEHKSAATNPQNNRLEKQTFRRWRYRIISRVNVPSATRMGRKRLYADALRWSIDRVTCERNHHRLFGSVWIVYNICQCMSAEWKNTTKNFLCNLIDNNNAGNTESFGSHLTKN